jgi:hypothetical protein
MPVNKRMQTAKHNNKKRSLQRPQSQHNSSTSFSHLKSLNQKTKNAQAKKAYDKKSQTNSRYRQDVNGTGLSNHNLNVNRIVVNQS